MAGRLAERQPPCAPPAPEPMFRSFAQLQRMAGNQAVSALVIQRQQARRRRLQVPPTALVSIVVRDRGIDAGGATYADDLEAAKRILMGMRNAAEWTLVLAIHGSQDRLGAQAPPDWQRNARFYDAAAVNALFGGDPAFVRWRDQHGPARLVMLSCQVSARFERTLIANLTRPAGTGQTRQSPQGLGEGCRPMITIEQLVYDNPRLGFGNATIVTRAQWNRIPADDRVGLEQQLQDFNNEFGYFGGPPVPASEVLHYYFDLPPRGGWAKVEVGVGPHGSETPTGIPFWNRSSGPRRAEFNRLCDRGIGHLPSR
ncbi:hypothetical protein [Frankia sp. Cj5]|uniref:hypothetical protein n=1 Tax=Frankia sp. Cj5 TaxID=2880978 RepID=UPI001EF751A1|nr:hypothetical protein [Frankia sp. Cj5]